MLTPGAWTHWNDITGFAIDIFGIWGEIWGDGVNLGGTEWDDANSLSGDGWSSDCKIETGFQCKGTNCYEIIRPTARVSSVSNENLVSIEFSELVKFSSYSEMKDNLRWNIKGPDSPYEFEFEIHDPDQTLRNSIAFNTMQVSIFNIKASLRGGGIEKVELWLEDLTSVTDIVGNKMSEGKISGNLNYYDYISSGLY